jgi:glycosyltransferase involved in cell wall biosynthesis
MSRLLRRFLRQYEGDFGTYDLVYAHHECLDTSMLARYLAEKYNIPFVILLHNEPFRPIDRIFRIRPVRSLTNLAELVPVLNLNLFTRFEYLRILASPHFREFFVISPAPLQVSGLSGVRHTILSPANALSNNLLPAPATGPEKGDYALYASRFGEEKGIFELPGIWKQIHEQQPAMKLLVYGNSSDEALEKFRDRVHTLSLDDSIIVQGYVPSATDFLRVVSRARVLLHPSHSDGFSMIILESLAHGTPVVA